MAVLKGEVKNFKENDNYSVYDSNIILKHSITTDFFYTLFGHLWIDSIKYIQIGKVMGDIAINWDYDLHLYFQIIRKLIGIFENYPGADS